MIAPSSKKERMARVTGLEPATSGVTGRRSNQLSYTRVSAWVPRLYGSSADLSTAVPRFFRNGGFPGENRYSPSEQAQRVFPRHLHLPDETGRVSTIDSAVIAANRNNHEITFADPPVTKSITNGHLACNDAIRSNGTQRARAK